MVDRFGVDMTIRTLREFPTIRAFSKGSPMGPNDGPNLDPNTYQVYITLFVQTYSTCKMPGDIGLAPICFWRFWFQLRGIGAG